MADADRVYLEHDVTVQMPATQENPGGRVRQLKAGWVALDDELRAHPIISRLMPESESERGRQKKLFAAEQEHNDAVNEAGNKLAQVRAEIEAERREERDKTNEQYQKRVDEAARDGTTLNVPHPDPETSRAFALTAPPGTHAVPSASLAQKPEADKTRQEEEKALPSESEQLKKQEQTKENEDNKDEDGDVPKRARTRG